MTVSTRIYNYLSSRPGHKATFNEIERAVCSSKETVKPKLQELVALGKVKKHYPKAGGLTHWSVDVDTRPETRPLRDMRFPGAIFTPAGSSL